MPSRRCRCGAPPGVQERGFGRTPPANWRARGLGAWARARTPPAASRRAPGGLDLTRAWAPTQVRGAPAIAIAAALGLAVECSSKQGGFTGSSEEAKVTPKPRRDPPFLYLSHPGVELRENLRSISHRCHLFEVACVWELTKETIHLPLGCLQGGAS